MIKLHSLTHSIIILKILQSGPLSAIIHCFLAEQLQVTLVVSHELSCASLLMHSHVVLNFRRVRVVESTLRPFSDDFSSDHLLARCDLFSHLYILLLRFYSEL